MKIQSSDVQMNSQSISLKEQTKTVSLKVWVGNQRPDFENRGAISQAPVRDSIDLSEQAKSASQGNMAHGKKVRTRGHEMDDDPTANDPVIRLLRMLMESITGKKANFRIIRPQDESPDPKGAQQLNQATNAVQAQAQPQPGTAGFGLEYDSRETYFEAQSMSFSARGMIRTSDGKQIDFNLELSMQRAFYSESTTSLRLGDAVQKDPLIINFNGAAAELTSTKFSFDLDVDGSADQISFVGPNSGFIALDKNNDGKVNDGSELFGTSSGNGFRDLAVYDQDQNGWIDDNDPVFSQLKVWMKDAMGNDSLNGLKTMGVGALYLGNVSTDFDLKTASNESLGTLRASSVYLKENGAVGTIQDLDLTL